MHMTTTHGARACRLSFLLALVGAAAPVLAQPLPAKPDSAPVSAAPAAEVAGANTAARVAPPPPPPGPGLELATGVAQAAIADCAANGYKVGVTVVDSKAGVRLILAQDEARQQAVASSTAKAVTVIRYRQSSGALAQRASTDSKLAAEIAADATLRARAGGLPLVIKGEIIGAIGVGGAPGGEKDEACAAHAIARYPDRLEPQ